MFMGKIIRSIIIAVVIVWLTIFVCLQSNTFYTSNDMQKSKTNIVQKYRH